ncbi:MAG: biotin--[acetyl-CoA-carboxylase] ligase [Nitrospirae bacterium]|nr:biotin--[acetyl-CoA-carboxylase] ligase [Nitrospirota bacterium]
MAGETCKIIADTVTGVGTATGVGTITAPGTVTGVDESKTSAVAPITVADESGGTTGGISPAKEPILSESAWKTRYGKWKIFLYGSVGSTNDVAKTLFLNHQTGQWTAVIANHQWAGRGRFNRKWFSPSGLNVCMTLIVKAVELRNLPLMNVALSLATVKAINKATNLATWPRWPNDLYCGEKKLGGILSESISAANRITHVLMGIGINVNTRSEHFSPELRLRATSLLEETGLQWARWDIVRSILDEFATCYTAIDNDKTTLLDQWSRACRTIGRKIRISTHDGEVDAVALGIDETGRLIVERSSGIRITISAGDLLDGSVLNCGISEGVNG